MSKLTNEEKRQRGIKLSPIKHTHKRRAPWHDYAEVGTYMLTLVTEGRRPLFGRLVCEPAPKAQAIVAAPATVAGGSAASLQAHIALSPLGQAIASEEIRKIPQFYPQVKVWKLCVMPDHLHIILRVGAPLPKGKHLDSIVSGFKYGCTMAHRRLLGLTEDSPTPEVRTTVAALFEPGYNDRILLDDGQLDRWKHYLDDNPRRLSLKRLHPDLFTIRHGRQVGEWSCQMVGNMFLLDIPDKAAVIVHRADSDEEYDRKKATWLTCGERGGVLVSAAISPREKAVMREAFDRGYRTILLRENGFPPLYKPSGESFNACIGGLLLQISPWGYHHDHKTISRDQCLRLNRLAEEIARM